jgi:hypothetical protein
MDANTLKHWRMTIKKSLADLAAIPFPEVVDMNARTVFDESVDAYLVMVEGWQEVRRLHGCLAHVEIRGDKIWILQDGTERGIAADLLDAGVPRDRIVLGFKSPHSRGHTRFAVA